jgi:urease accessory protein
MKRDAAIQRGDRPTLFTNLRDRDGLDSVLSWLQESITRIRTEQLHAVS